MLSHRIALTFTLLWSRSLQALIPYIWRQNLPYRWPWGETQADTKCGQNWKKTTAASMSSNILRCDIPSHVRMLPTSECILRVDGWGTSSPRKRCSCIISGQTRSFVLERRSRVVARNPLPLDRDCCWQRQFSKCKGLLHHNELLSKTDLNLFHMCLAESNLIVYLVLVKVCKNIII